MSSLNAIGDNFDTPTGGVTSPFEHATARYRVAGWRDTLPLPRGLKNPPPTGFTGHQGQVVTNEQVAQWRAMPKYARANICLRLAEINDPADNSVSDFEVVGIDVDHYIKGGKDKRGGDQLAALEAKLGKLPDTWISSARADGISGIRYFRVPAGLMFRGQVDKDIECVYRGYRFAVVWPSTNPDAGGATYWWFPPGSTATSEHRSRWNPQLDAVPGPTTLPLLPDVWLDHLTQGRTPATDSPIDMDSTAKEIDQWADAAFNNGTAGAACARVGKSLASLKAEIETEATSHDKIVKAHFHLYRLAAEGHTGWKSAVDEVETVWADEVIARDKRSRSELRSEIFRSRIQALRKIKGLIDQATTKGARYTPTNCTCAVPEHLAVGPTMTLCDEQGCQVEIITLRGQATGTQPATAILTVLGPAEWAKPVAATEFLISKVLCADTFGVNAGPKKSLKTHDNQAIAFAVATGIDLYRCPKFPVRRHGRVLYIVGEGGVNPVRRTMQRMARAYGLDPAEVAADPDFGITAAFGAAPIDAPDFRDELRRLLDEHQPELVLIESFYNFHPKDVEAANLFSRGQVIDGHHKFVRGECAGATSIMTDHYRSTGGKSLDLDNISMAGQAENADSWITRIHRNEANVAAGQFYLQTGFGSRQWGGTEWHVDWDLGRFDHDTGSHVGDISWAVKPASSAGERGSQPHSETELAVLRHVREHPWTLNRATLHAAVGGRKDTVLKAVTRLLDGRELSERAPEHGQGKAMMLGPGKLVVVLPGGVA